MADRRLLVVVNPGASRAETELAPAIGALAAAGFEIDLRRSRRSEDLGALIVEGARSCDAVLVGGGDGTVNGALGALIEAGKPVGILPLGTANDLALTLGIPADAEGAAGVVAAGRTRRIDIARANGRPFANAASVGLGVEIALHQDSERKQNWRVLSYLLTTIEVLGEAERFRATIECDNRRFEVETYQIAVGNGVFYGGGMRVAEDAAIDDGMLDVYAIEAETIGELMTLAPALRAGTQIHSDCVTALRCRSVRIETDQPLSVNTDGEVTTKTPLEITVDPAALDIFAPPPAA
ncbi:lipid kinase [Microbaculum marinum]|uniref:Lipid kinase n=1 Tax=Microbaculum marinum TaxID=1764581 RepID=A0AAW9RMX6_9HYPH